jgi:hypothetical protein
MEFWGERSRSLYDVLPPTGETSLTTYHLVSSYVTIGITSYIGLQDLLTRMLQVRIQQSLEPIGQNAFKQRRGIEPESRGADLWRWGCERYM